jgi:hypothetical protein
VIDRSFGSTRRPGAGRPDSLPVITAVERQRFSGALKAAGDRIRPRSTLTLDPAAPTRESEPIDAAAGR